MTAYIIISLSAVMLHVMLEHIKIDFKQKQAYFDQYVEDMLMIRSRLRLATSVQEVEQIHSDAIMIGRSYDLWVESRL